MIGPCAQVLARSPFVVGTMTFAFLFSPHSTSLTLYLEDNLRLWPALGVSQIHDHCSRSRHKTYLEFSLKFEQIWHPVGESFSAWLLKPLFLPISQPQSLMVPTTSTSPVLPWTILCLCGFPIFLHVPLLILDKLSFKDQAGRHTLLPLRLGEGPEHSIGQEAAVVWMCMSLPNPHAGNQGPRS